MSTEIYLKYAIPADGPDETVGRLSRHFIVDSWHKADGEGRMVYFDWHGQWYSVPASNVLAVITRPKP